MNKRNGTNIIGFGGAFKYYYQEKMQAHGITMKVCVHCAQGYSPVAALHQGGDDGICIFVEELVQVQKARAALQRKASDAGRC